MRNCLAKIAIVFSSSLFILSAYSSSYCSGWNTESIFHVFPSNPNFRILSNQEDSGVGFEDTCDDTSCFFHTCNSGRVQVVIGATNWSKFCTIDVYVASGKDPKITSYTCTINGSDAGDKMKVTPIEPTGSRYFKFDIKG